MHLKSEKTSIRKKKLNKLTPIYSNLKSTLS